MNRLSLIVCCVIVGVAALVVASKRAESGAADAIVRLQASTPGTQQVGHANLSGTIRAGAFVGSGAGLSGVPWAAITGAPTTLLALPYSGSTSTPGNAFSVTQNGSGTALLGSSTSSSGLEVGVNGLASGFDGVGVSGYASHATGDTYGVIGTAESPAGTGVFGYARSTIGGGVGVRAITDSPSGYAILADNSAATGNGAGIRSTVQSPDATAIVAVATSTSGSSYGLYGVSNGATGTGVFGGGGYYGVHGQTPGSSGAAVYAQATNTTGTAVGVLSVSSSPTGLAGYFIGDTIFAGNVGIGTIPAPGSQLFVSGSASECLLLSNLVGRGLQSVATHDTAVWGRTTDGFAGVDARNGGTSGIALYAEAFSGAGSTVGVFGVAPSPAGYAVWAQGRSGASGTKSFRIDHPLDPENKYLLHYSAEGPEALNVYCGTVRTDEQGEAWVQLPNYFESINRDFKYQLTIVDDTDSDLFVQAKVARKIKGNRFKVRTNAPNIEVSWEVKGVRNDRWVQAYGAPVETEKPFEERGKYQHPELYGLGADKAIHPLLGSAAPPKRTH